MAAIRFVLNNTTHPGNIGACARAIKNMGFSDLCLVNPLIYPSEEANKRASGAEDLLQSAKVVSHFKEAIADCHLVFGSSARQRSLSIPLISPREAAALVKEAHLTGNNIALLFGQERMGLTNVELDACHYHLYIPCNPGFPSLNLAQAVQIVAYELHMASFQSKSAPETTGLASGLEMELFYQQLEKTLQDIEFLSRDNPRQMMRKLRRLFNRAKIEQNEMNILRGILTMISRRLKIKR